MNANRKRKTKAPCERCGLNRALCMCELIPRLELKTRVTLLIHARELKRTTNTGRLAIHALKNSEMIVRGAGRLNETTSSKRAPPLDLSSAMLTGYRQLLFFPSDEAVELTPDSVAGMKDPSRPVQLLVPDGNWRQASKVNSRHPEIANVPRVKISTPSLSVRHLRREHKSEGMSTLEAIARAIGIIESREAEAVLLELYAEKLARTLQGRGQFDEDVIIPQKKMQIDGS